MASFDRVIKHLVEKFQTALAPLEKVVKNQEIMIAQNKQIIELLGQLNNGRLPESDPENEMSNCPNDSASNTES